MFTILSMCDAQKEIDKCNTKEEVIAYFAEAARWGSEDRKTIAIWSAIAGNEKNVTPEELVELLLTGKTVIVILGTDFVDFDLFT